MRILIFDIVDYKNRFVLFGKNESNEVIQHALPLTRCSFSPSPFSSITNRIDSFFAHNKLTGMDWFDTDSGMFSPSTDDDWMNLVWKHLKIETREGGDIILVFDDTDVQVVKADSDETSMTDKVCTIIEERDPDFIQCAVLPSLISRLKAKGAVDRLSRSKEVGVSWSKRGDFACPGRICYTEDKSYDEIITVTRISYVALKFSATCPISTLIEKTFRYVSYGSFLMGNGERQDGDNQSYSGGLQLEPTREIFNEGYTACLDVKSMYPSLVVEYEICPSVYWTSTPVPKFLPSLMKRLIEKRTEIKTKKENNWERRQLAVKLFSNAIIGEFGRPGSSLYCIPIAESITSFGRNTLERIAAKATTTNKVIYGNTDSIFVKLEALSLEEATEEVRRLVGAINEEVLTPNIVIGLDFLTDFLVIIEKNNLIYTKEGLVNIKGWPAVSKSAFPFMVDTAHGFVSVMLYSKCNKIQCQQYLNDRVAIMRQPNNDVNQFVVKIKLGQDVGKYHKDTTAANVVAIRKAKNVLLSDFKAGTIVSVVHTVGGPELFSSDLQAGVLDYDKYETQLLSPFAKLMEMMGGDVGGMRSSSSVAGNKTNSTTMKFQDNKKNFKKTKLDIRSFFDA
jgi:DNA polymerase elongation subunit (family B)